MHEHVKKMWVDALRSRKYPQGHGALKTEEGYCCWGLLCEISGLGSWVYGNDGTFYVVGDERGDAYIPNPVADWAGIERYNPRLQYFSAALDPHRGLAQYNDNYYSFDDIADMIDTGVYRSTYGSPTPIQWHTEQPE
jgi:hypothetical protein